MIGKNLKKARKKLGLKQVELAKILNMNQSEISKIENNEYKPLILTYIKYLRSQDIDINDLFNDEIE